MAIHGFILSYKKWNGWYAVVTECYVLFIYQNDTYSRQFLNSIIYLQLSIIIWDVFAILSIDHLLALQIQNVWILHSVRRQYNDRSWMIPLCQMVLRNNNKRWMDYVSSPNSKAHGANMGPIWGHCDVIPPVYILVTSSANCYVTLKYHNTFWSKLKKTEMCKAKTSN